MEPTPAAIEYLRHFEAMRSAETEAFEYLTEVWDAALREASDLELSSLTLDWRLQRWSTKSIGTYGMNWTASLEDRSPDGEVNHIFVRAEDCRSTFVDRGRAIWIFAGANSAPACKRLFNWLGHTSVRSHLAQVEGFEPQVEKNNLLVSTDHELGFRQAIEEASAIVACAWNCIEHLDTMVAQLAARAEEPAAR